MREDTLRFPDRRRGLQRTVAKHVRFDKELGRWVSDRVRVYVGPRKVART